MKRLLATIGIVVGIASSSMAADEDLSSSVSSLPTIAQSKPAVDGVNGKLEVEEPPVKWSSGMLVYRWLFAKPLVPGGAGLGHADRRCGVKLSGAGRRYSKDECGPFVM